MQTLTVEGRQIELNDKGYLVNFEDWDKDVAEALARADHLTLTHCHWIAIDFMRDFYRQYEIPLQHERLFGRLESRSASTDATTRCWRKSFLRVAAGTPAGSPGFRTPTVIPADG